MKTLSLSPAGKQPVRIAYGMAIVNESPTKLQMLRNAIAAKCTRRNVLAVAAVLTALAAYVCGIAYGVKETTGAWVGMSACAMASMTALVAAMMQKGGSHDAR